MENKKIFLAKLNQNIKSDDYIKYLLSTYYGYDFNTINIIRTENQKPYIKNSDLFYSVSHKKDYIIAAVSNQEIGIDMEIIDEKYRQSIVDKYFFDEEKKYIESVEEEKNIRFFDIWTKKEAYIKRMNMILADIKKIDTSDKNIFTFRLGDIIISLCE